ALRLVVACSLIAFATASHCRAYPRRGSELPGPFFKTDDTTLLHPFGLRRFHAVSVCNCLVSGTFNLPSRALFSFHSRYYCAIGLGTYFGLDVNATQIRARYPTRATRETPNHLPRVPLRGCHPLWPRHSTGVSRSRGKVCRSPNTTPPAPFGAGFGLPNALFDRLY